MNTHNGSSPDSIQDAPITLSPGLRFMSSTPSLVGRSSKVTRLTTPNSVPIAKSPNWPSSGVIANTRSPRRKVVSADALIELAKPGLVTAGRSTTEILKSRPSEVTTPTLDLVRVLIC